jgi:predicted ATPase/signal transduction histidine kinase/CheY-like chemotaxis protein
MTPSAHADVERLGEGKWSTLYRAVRQLDDRRVLIEVPSADADEAERTALLTRTLELGSTLESPFVLRALRVVSFGGRAALELEDRGGEPLQSLLSFALTPAAFLELAVRLTSAVADVHERGVVHGALAPRYILVARETSTVALTGLWHAERLNADGVVPRHVARIEDSLPYAAPEQIARLSCPVDRRADLYSLGVIFFELLTGRPPFEAKDAIGWVHAQVARRPPSPSQLSPAIPSVLSAIVLKLLEKAPDARYRSAAGLLEDLRRCVAALGTTGEIAPFSLGQADVCDVFTMPRKLYGRERERAELLAAFEHALQGDAPRLMLVSGAPGAGKSSLVHELASPCAARGGRFVVGKIGPFEREVPYAAFVHALRELVLDLSVESSERMSEYRARAGAALGSAAALVCRLVPELGRMLGIGAEADDLTSAQTEKRLRGALRRFIAAFSTRVEPLVIFLDDVQWVDRASVDLLVELASDTDLRQLFVVAAYREGELGSIHPLRQALERLSAHYVAIAELHVGALSPHDLEQLLADLARVEVAEAAPLARVIHEKTYGEPLFVSQLLSELHRRGLIVFESAAGRWRWDLTKIIEEPCSENVTELLVARLRELPPATQDTLGLAAHLGRNIDPKTLQLVVSGDPGPALETAVSQGLLLLVGGKYRFPHDRVREAAYSLIAEGEREATHLRIGRLLWAGTPDDLLGERCFELAHHLNLGATLIASAAERERVAELNLRAGRRAQASAARALARGYFAAGSALLGERGWQDAEALALALGIGLLESELSLGDVDAAERLIEQLETHARASSDRSAVVRARATLLVMRSDFFRCVQVLAEFLTRAGVDCPLEPSDQLVRDEYDRLRAALGERPIESLLELGEADASTEATMEVLFMVVEIASSTDERLMRFAACRMANLSIERGHCDASPLAFVHLGQMVGPYFGDYQSGFRFARLGLALQEARRRPRFTERVLVMAGAFVYPWTQPLTQALALLRRGFEASVESGEPVFAWLSLRAEASLRLFAGDPLPEVERVLHRAREVAQKAKLGSFFFAMTTLTEQLTRALRGLTSSFPSFDETNFTEREFEARLASDPNLVIPHGWYWIRKLQARCYGGDHETARAAAAHAEALIWTTGYALERVEYNVFRALAEAAGLDDSAPDERARRRGALAECARALEARAADCPSNFAACAALVTAELARADGDDQAPHAYERAIGLARDHAQLPILAVAYETAAAFYAARGLGSLESAYLREAHEAYRRWGAEGVVTRLERRNPALVVRSSSGQSSMLDLRPEQLDLLAVIKASQAISGVMQEQQVMETLLRIVLERGGARRARLVLAHEDDEDDGQLEVAAEVSSEDASPLLQPAPRVPTSIVDYVRRTETTVLLEDAAKDAGRFAKDPYLTRARPRSLLCLPVRHHGTLAGILYLDNDLAPGVFTPERILALELLATQAAVSLQNAHLLARERAAREEAQRDRQRALLLGEVTALLSDSGDQPPLSEAVRLVCAAGIADWALLDVPRVGSIECAAYAHRDPAREQLLAEFVARGAERFWAVASAPHSFGASTPYHQASLSDEQIRACCLDEEHAALARKLGLRSLLVVPLRLRGRKLGALLLVAATPHHFQPADVELSAELGRRLGMAMESARLAEIESLLHQSQKMEALGRLAGGVAHDFNNVLSVILGYSEFARARFSSDDPAHEDLDEIGKAAERASSLTRQLLAFSRHRLVEPGVVDVCSGAAQRPGQLPPVLGSQVKLLLRPSQNLWKTRVDRGHVEQLLMNLAANARDAMARDGTLLIETANVDVDESYAREHLEFPPGEYVMLAVTDTGCGMDPGVRARIFEPFFTTKKPGEGTGLGLATVFGIVRQSGGHVAVDSEVGRGTTFRIYLPRCEADADDPEPAEAALVTVSAHGSETILLVEDDEQVRGAARAALQLRGYKVLEASGPGDALLICEQHAGPIELLLSDVVMPRMTGPELAERIVAARPGIRLLFMSGYTETPILRHGLGDYQLDFLQKPFTPRALAECVRRVLDHHKKNGTRHSG